MRTIYEGRRSCYAKREGLYVKRFPSKGVSSYGQAVAIATLICYDYHRRRTYDGSRCVEEVMNKELFERRLNFLIMLAGRHSKALEGKVRRLVHYCLKHRKPPKRDALRALKLLKVKDEEGEKVLARIRRWLRR